MTIRHGVMTAMGCGILLVSLAAVAQDAPPAPAAAQAQKPADQPRPKMVLAPTEFDFGEVWEGAPAQGEFTIKNVGDAPLTIKSRTSCGCTVATKPKSPLEPGEETTFTVSYRTTHMGRANKKVILTTNDPDQETVSIPVNGLVKALLEKTPGSAVLFRDLGVQSDESQTIKLTNKYDKPVHLKLNEQESNGQYKYELVELVNGKEYELKVSTNPPMKEGRNAGRAVLETDLAEVPKITISVSGTVPERLSVRPATILMSPSMKEPSERTVRVQFRTDEPLHITDVQTTPKLEYEIVPPADSDNQRATSFYQVRLMLPGYDEIPDTGAKVIILTDDKNPEFARLEVPIQKRQQGHAAAGNTPTVHQPVKRDDDLRGMDPDEIRKRIEDAIREQQAAKQPANQPQPDEPKGEDDQDAG